MYVHYISFHFTKGHQLRETPADRQRLQVLAAPRKLYQVRHQDVQHKIRNSTRLGVIFFIILRKKLKSYHKPKKF